MNIRNNESRRTPFALAPLVLALAWVGTANAAEYWLCAKPTTLTMPDSQVIAMWGFAGGKASDGITSLAGACAAAASVPGPGLDVPPGDNTLTIHLQNDLSGAGSEPVSIVIPGQTTSMTPVMHTSGPYAGRVRSFTAEAAVGGGSQDYTWNNLKPGTYLYHSGSHPQVQVQMGLYGALTHDAATGQAYTGVTYDSQATLLFSEIDPGLHAAVAAGTYGPGGTVTSTVNYLPRYFLINGSPYTAGSLPLAAGSVGQPTLLRLLNAGLKSRNPILQGSYMNLVAEDGNPYPYVRTQYSAFLPALKTVDAVFTPPAPVNYPIYDRRLAVSNPGPTGPSDGGMLAFLGVTGSSPSAPTAGPDAYATDEDMALAIAAPGVLGNDSAGTTASLLTSTTHGSVSLAADGSFTYTPQANFNGPDSFTYQAMSGGLASTPATVSLTVNPVNDAPVAANNAYSISAGLTLNVAAPGILGNDSDIDSAVLTAVNPSALGGLTLNADGSFSYVAPATAGDRSFTYQASDGTATSNTATVTITVTSNQAPVAIADTFRVTRNTTVDLNVKANDSDSDGTLGTVAIAVAPNKGGTVSVNPDGSVHYTPALNFRGTENFSYRVQDNLGAWSNVALVRVNVR